MMPVDDMPVDLGNKKEFIYCNLCEQNYYKILFNKKGYYIVKCRNCGLIYVTPRVAWEKIRQIYSEVYFHIKDFPKSVHSGYRDYIEDIKLHKRNFDRKFKYIESVEPPGRILDIGCATGFFLDYVRDKGWKPYGVEISEYACKYAARELGLNVFNGTLEEAEFEDEFFDVVTIFGTLEHIRDPLHLLIETHRILRDKGWILITTPNVNGIIARLMGKRWFEFKPKEHLYYFTPETITKMLRKAGFDIEKICHLGSLFSFKYIFERMRYYSNSYIIQQFSEKIETLFRKLNLLDKYISLEIGEMTIYARK